MFTMTQNPLDSAVAIIGTLRRLRMRRFTAFTYSMHSLVLNGEPIKASMVSPVAKFRLFQTKPKLLSKPFRVESTVSSNSLLAFVDAIGGAVPRSPTRTSQLCDEFEFTESAKAVGEWQAQHPVIRHELDLVHAALEERLESQARTMSMRGQALHRR
jgi:hypothetical protein